MQQISSPKPPLHTTLNLKNILYNRIYYDILKPTLAKCNGWTILVLDEETTKIMNCILRMSDLIDLGISIIEKLEFNRQAFPELPVIYFVTASETSIEYILNDFPNEKKSKYANIHLFFTSHIEDREMNNLKQNSILLSKIKSCKEVHIEFIIPEKSVFLFDLPWIYRQFYSPVATNTPSAVLAVGNGSSNQQPSRAQIIEETLTTLAQKLVSFCATIQEYPYVRYTKTCKRMNQLAQLFQKKMNDFVASNQWFQYHPNRGTLLLLERNQDPISPLVHEFTYQAMLYDMIDIKNDQITYPCETNAGKVEKVAVLNEQDELWSEFRHTHIADISQQLSTRMKDLANSNGAAYIRNRSESNEISEMATALRNLPEYQEQLRKISQHIYLAGKLMETAMSDEKLMQFPLMEQTLLTGVDENKKQVKEGQALFKDIEKLMEGSNVPPIFKVRLLAILFATQEGMKEKDRKALIALGGLAGTIYEAALTNLSLCNIVLARETGPAPTSTTSALTLIPTNTKLTSKDIKEAKLKAETCEYATWRYEPPLKSLLKKIIDGELPLDLYPYIIAPPAGMSPATKEKQKSAPVSMRKKNPTQFKTATHKEPEEKEDTKGDRLIVFMVGGACYSELRSIYELREKEKEDIFLGTTHLIKPKIYIEEIANLTNAKCESQFKSDYAAEMTPAPSITTVETTKKK